MTAIYIRDPKEAGWYLARPFPQSTNDEPPVVVRVSPDPAGVTTVWRIGFRDPSTLEEWRLVGKVHASGGVTDLDLKEAYASGIKQGREDAHREQVEYEARRDRECPTFSVDYSDIEDREIGEPVLAIRMTASTAERVASGLSDLLCWAAGFKAALGADESDRAPMGVSEIGNVNIALKTVLRHADEAKESRHG